MVDNSTLSEIQKKIVTTRERLDLYLAREKEMLTGGVQSYGVGSRNLTRYNTDLSAIRAAIEELKKELEELEVEEKGGKTRKAFTILPRDW